MELIYRFKEKINKKNIVIGILSVAVVLAWVGIFYKALFSMGGY